MQRFSSVTRKLIPAAAAAATVLGLSSCVTRTVYVVDDRDRPPPMAQAQAPAPAPVVSVSIAAAPVAYEADVGIVDESDFYEPLSPYGTWVAYPGYGRVWRPSVTVVGASFRPYTHGHWENTEWGWTWVDHHPFGWATGHYGRWLYDSNYGWVWTPGTVWSPAWVTWRTGGGYVGWSAMPPGASYGGSYAVYDTSWVFVSNRHFGSAYVGGVIITGAGYRTCYSSTYDSRTTYVVYGRQYYRGPDYEEVRREGNVIHRPLRETERERPVSRPPAGTVIARGRDRDRDPTSDSRSRDRDDDSARDVSSRNAGRDGRAPADGTAPYVDDRGAPAAVRDRVVDADGRADPDPATGNERDGSTGNERDGSTGNGRDDAAGGAGVRAERPAPIGSNNDRDAGLDGRSKGRDTAPVVGTPVTRPGRPDAIGDNNDRDAARRPVTGREPPPATTYPDDGRSAPPPARGDVRLPEPEKPRKVYAEDPDRFPSAGRSVRTPTGSRATPTPTPPSRAAPAPSAPSAPRTSRPAVEAQPEAAAEATPTKKKTTTKAKPKASSSSKRR